MNYFGLGPLAQDLQTSRRSFLVGATALGSSLIIGFSAVMFNFGVVNVFFHGLHAYSGL